MSVNASCSVSAVADCIDKATAKREATLTLRATIVVAPNVVPGLMAFLDHAVGWELDRRAGQAYALQGPMAAIPDEERAASLDTLAVLAIFFRRDRRHEGEPIAALLDRVASILRADAKKPDSLH